MGASNVEPITPRDSAVLRPSPCDEGASAPGITFREGVLLELARRDKSNQGETFHAITEAASAVLEVGRVSIWALVDHEVDAQERIVCKDLYLRAEGLHATFAPIHREDFPAYFDALNERRTIAAHDAQCDPRTAEFAEPYLKPLGITSMLDT